MAKNAKLSDKQQRFCEEYIIDLNATQAALRAGYCAKTVNPQGSQNLAKLSIQAEIQRLKDIRAKRLQISQDNVLKELSCLAFSNIKSFMDIEDDEVYFKDLSSIPDDITAAIESVKVMKKTIKGKKEDDDDIELSTIQFKLCSKLNALEQVGKHLGLYEKDNSQKAQSIFDILAIVGINVSNEEPKAISGTVG